MRLLAGLEENDSLTVAECLGAFCETRAIAGLAALALRRFVSIDIDSAPIGPSTSVGSGQPENEQRRHALVGLALRRTMLEVSVEKEMEPDPCGDPGRFHRVH